MMPKGHGEALMLQAQEDVINQASRVDKLIITCRLKQDDALNRIGLASGRCAKKKHTAKHKGEGGRMQKKKEMNERSTEKSD
jgi:alanine racemase